MDHRPDTAKTRPLNPGAGDASSESAVRFAAGDLLGTRYRIVSLLAVGGMGEVYRADDVDLGQTVALKILPERFAHDHVMIERLRSEVRIARPIVHPNVVRVFDVGEIDGVHFLTMEFVDGEDLASLIARSGPPACDVAHRIAREVCAGLAAIHDHAVLHRDLKPGNVLVEHVGSARLTDFGLAHAVGEALGPDATIGTPVYMSPEQLATGHTTIRSDIYSLALLLFELYTGRALHRTTALAELRRLHRLEPVTLLDQSGLTLPAHIRLILTRCLERDPTQRLASVREVAAAIDASGS